MAKVFIAFFNGLKGVDDKQAIPLFFEGFINGLAQSGNDIMVVMHSYWNKEFKEIPENLYKDIKAFNPDVIFTFNNAFYDLSQEFDCPIVIYDVDSPLYYTNKEKLKANPDRYFYFENQEDAVQLLQSEFNVSKKNILLVPFFTEIRAEYRKKKQNICFIGTKFKNNSKNCINSFMELKPNSEEVRQYTILINKLKNNPFLSKEELLKDIVSEKVKQYFNLYEIIFLLSDTQRIQTLAAVSDLGLTIWGTPNWAIDNFSLPYVNLSYNHTPVYSIKHNQDIYNSSKIGISIGHLQAKSGFPWRIFDIMASNACLVTDYHSGFKKYFPKLKLPYFESPYEAREKCIKLLKDEPYRKELVQQSQEIVNKNHRFSHTLNVMESFLNLKLTNGCSMGGVQLLRLEKYLDAIELENSSTFVPTQPTIEKPKTLKNKVRYKIWKHLDKKLRKKGIIQ